ncbi:MAG: MFS transporter [Actinomycetia bacterium]|nr:MFS transporter [Actinomycetes bacterium]MCP4961696.1 MFS transporter [Actinomycetes bacterium]
MSRGGRGRELLPYQITIGLIAGAIGGIITVMGELRDELGFSDGGIGIVVASGFLAAFVAQLTLAQYADRGHARTMAAAGLFVIAASLFGMVFAEGLFWWVVARAALGFGGGVAAPGIRRAATVLDPDNVGENLGRLVVGEVVGFMGGPILAAVLAEIGGIRLPFLAFGVAMALFAPATLRLPADRGHLDASGRSNSFDLLKLRRLQGALLFVGGYFILIGAFESVMPLMFRDRGGSTLQTGLAFTSMAVPIAIVSPFAGRTADRIGPPKVATIGISIVAIVSMSIGFLPGILIPAAVMAIVGIADGFGFLASQIAVSRAVAEDRQAAALGLMGAVEVLGAGLAAFPAAVLYGAAGEEVTWMALGLSTLVIVGLAWSRLAGTEPVNKGGTELHWTPIDRSPEPTYDDPG